MPYHMLVVFDRETAHPPVGLESFVPERKSSLSRWPDEEEGAEAACRAALERTYSNSKPEMRKLELLGHGNGFTFEASPFCSYAHRDGVHVLMGGEVSVWPSSINAVNMAHDAFMRGSPAPEASDAHWLLDYYASFMMGESDQVAQQALECLSQVQGSFAFVIFDATQHRVFAARDTEGAQPLFWGVTDEGQLLFGSHVADLEGCNPSATAFPGGTLFASESHTLAYSPGAMGWVIQQDDYPGRMLSFIRDGASWRNVRAIPRVTPEGALCGAVYKVGSAHHLAGAAQ